MALYSFYYDSDYNVYWSGMKYCHGSMLIIICDKPFFVMLKAHNEHDQFIGMTFNQAMKSLINGIPTYSHFDESALFVTLWTYG